MQRRSFKNFSVYSFWLPSRKREFHAVNAETELQREVLTSIDWWNAEQNKQF